jgi:hypothetical protein
MAARMGSLATKWQNAHQSYLPHDYALQSL